MALEHYGGPPDPDYEIRAAVTCPCGCQDAGRDEDTLPLVPLDGRAALIRITEFRAMTGPQ
jgi:hypothetical protein